ncbi:rust resistance kinase Lr10-like [Phragmites australis]|uniref:rust resistance kinase Lr10-like n=1 Tax=Phragmites australis TaxID=29695 RepID=UPI002D77D7FA|nr:rust resistance kinase Lr10-like [Phragmites australis]
MSGFLAIALLLCLLKDGTYKASAWDDKDFFRYCPPSRCSEHGPEIRFPFRLESSNTPSLCGAPCMKLACSGEDTILVHPALSAYKVIAIDYRLGRLTIIPRAGFSSPCQLIDKIISASVALDLQSSCLNQFRFYHAVIVRCLGKFTPHSDDADFIAGPVSCLSNATYFSYLVSPLEKMYVLPLDCKVSDGKIPLPVPDTSPSTFKETAERMLNFDEMTSIIYYHLHHFRQNEYYYPDDEECTQCEGQGRRCAFSSQRNQTFCMRHGSHVKVIAATSSVAALVVLLLMVASALYLSLKGRYNEEIHLKVEMFLKTYGTSKPTRYTFSEVKKIARRFKEKIGQGGFGSVYKGELPNGVPVAVKMLENSTGEGEDFINEVATIGLIHHANIVRLLGFCSEGTRRALIYEFMPNESLEKYIFLPDSSTSKELLPNKMVDVALGIARGMEYLHQGCSKRILHFDIKPHNILLDYNFNPKISDFGLAKLCARDQSIVTLTAARGTMGYIAPELYSRNFGGVSYKSDVYSFGMLVLEMVSGMRNSDPSVESPDEVYLPEWIFEKVITGQDLVLAREMTGEEKEKVRQLAIVALWCIQWNPKNRPSMTKVVNMLTGRLENLQIPPKPFVSSESHTMP